MSQIGVLNIYEIKTAEQELREFHERGLINDVKFEKLNKILEFIGEIDAKLIETNGDASIVYSEFKNKMVELESQISGLEENDKNFCLIVAAISRYSVFYWLNQASLTESPWHVPNCHSTGFKFSWGKLGAGDAVGAVAGATRFGVAALLGGPVGWGAAGTAALSTGLGASAGYAVGALFGWL